MSNKTSLQDLDTNKICQIDSKNHKIEIYQNEFFGNILTIDDTIALSTKDINQHSEMMAHTPLCTHPNATTVLLISHNPNIAKNILMHKNIQKIDMIQSIDILEIYKKYFDLDIQDTRLNISTKDTLDYLRDGQNSTYDVIIIDDMVDDTILAHSKRVLKPNGVIVVKNDNLMLSLDNTKTLLNILGKDYRIAMPCRYDKYSANGMQSSLIFASNKYHPTADLILHKSDLLDGLEYYHSDLHRYCFVLPQNIIASLKNIAKN